MRRMLDELYEYRHLLFMLTWKEVRIRYKQTVMGFFWALLMPMLIVAAGVLIRQAYSMYSGEAMNLKVVASLCVKSLPWAFFVGAIRFSTNSLTGNSNLVTKIYFPREVFPISAVLAHLFDFAIATFPVILIVALSGVGVSIHLLWLPVLLFLLILLAMGLGLLLSCGNLFFRDVKYIVDVFLTFGILFTPVFYDAKMLGKWATAILLNPVAPLLEAINHVVILHQTPDYPWMIYAACTSVLGFVLAWGIFKRAEYAFAENI